MTIESPRRGVLSRRGLLTAGIAALPLVAVGGRIAWAQADGSNDIVLDATETVNMEHEDRMFRIRQATQRLRIFPPPEFHTYTVPAERMPENFDVDTPILKVTFAESVFFDTASAVAREESDPILDAISQALRGDAPDAAVFVSGHTDNRGGDDYNYNLSISRANSVAEGLLDRGVGEVALWRVGFGEDVPLWPNDSPEHMGFNRRVEVFFSARTEPILDFLSRQLDDSVCVGGDARTTQRCRREVQVTREFTAVQLTRRPMNVGLARPGGRGGRGDTANPERRSGPRASNATRPASSGQANPERRSSGSNSSTSRITQAPPRTNTTASGQSTRPTGPTPTARGPRRSTINTTGEPIRAQTATINLTGRRSTLNAVR